VIAYRATLDVPRELVRYLARLLTAERRALGTPHRHEGVDLPLPGPPGACLVPQGRDKTLLGAGFGVSRVTAYRYLAEGIKVLSAQARDLHDALRTIA
jgi:hypothetical protein